MKPFFFVMCVLAGAIAGALTPEAAGQASEEKKASTPLASKAPTAPFAGKPHAIPGTIEAEHYDEGDAEIAYHDIDAKNHGAPLRGETQVDIEARADASGGHGIGWTKAGEWLIYTVDVKETGTYTIEMPVASQKEGGTFHLEFGGTDRTGPIRVPDTGSWQKLQLVTKRGVKLERGVQTMKIVMDTEGASSSIGDLDLFRFKRDDPASQAGR